MSNIHGVHLVGSVPLADAETVFRACSAGLDRRLRRITDGEPGERSYFTYFQLKLFTIAPDVLRDFALDYETEVAEHQYTPEQVEAGVEALKKSDMQTGYDTAAIDSYSVFKRLRDEGIIPKGVKFQVSLPTTPNVIAPFIQPAFQAPVAAIYEAALFKSMRALQDAIPHEDLAIQIDLAVDTAYWEGVWLKPWFDDVKTHETEYITRMIAQVDQDVELGLHNCYGDVDHRHWHEPKSLAAIAERGEAILAHTPHPIKFFHAPVPVSAMSTLPEYYAPLKELYPKLKEHGSELYLGLVHYNDLEGTKIRIAEAEKVVPEFGVATECGWGRTPADQIENIMKISREVSSPVL